MFWTSLKRTVAPVTTPVSLGEVKAHLALNHTDDDAYLTSLIEAATATIDGPTGIGVALIKQTWRATFDYVPHAFVIPLQPVRAITSIKVGTETLAVDRYDFDPDTSTLYCATPIYGSRSKRVKIEFEAGYDTVPADLRHAILMIVGHFYANREAVTTLKLEKVPMAVESILNRYRVHFV
jgi:uncharacterized phiE125 gp8 family phage protein